MAVHTRHQHRRAARVGILGSLAALFLVAAALATTSDRATGASSTVIVTMDVPSATTIDTSACGTNARQFGVLQPGTDAVTPAPCTVTFGSSNDTSSLQVAQQDGSGAAMSRETLGGWDNGFGGNGHVEVEFPEGNVNTTFGFVQPDGKVVYGGSVINGGGALDVAMVRLNDDGTPDSSFGVAGNGRVVTSLLATNTDKAWAGILDPDGKIVLTGTYWINALNTNCTMIRYLSDGTLDASFGGGDGHVEFDAGGFDECRGLTRLHDGSYVAVGVAWNGGTTNDTVIAKVRSDGTMDSSFGTAGVIRSDMTGLALDDVAFNVLELESGKLLINGDAANASDNDSYVARLLPDGSLDPTYQGGSIARFSWNGTSNDWSGNFDFDRTGSGFLASRTDADGTQDVVVYRIDAAGNLDSSWGGTGKAKHDFSGRTDTGYAVLGVDPNTALVVGGTQNGAPDGDWGMTMFRDGAVASDFNGGSPIQEDWNAQWDYAVRAARGTDGDIYVFGNVGQTTTGKPQMGAARLDGGGNIADYGGGNTFAGGGGVSMFGACLEAVAGAGVTGGWTVDAGGSCTATDADPWNAIPTSPETVATSTTSGLATASATLRFGAKAGTALAPGTYAAPLTFTVVAPAA